MESNQQRATTTLSAKSEENNQQQQLFDEIQNGNGIDSLQSLLTKYNVNNSNSNSISLNSIRDRMTGLCLLAFSIVLEKFDAFKALLEFDLDPMVRDPVGKRTCFHFACQSQDSRFLFELINRFSSNNNPSLSTTTTNKQQLMSKNDSQKTNSSLSSQLFFSLKEMMDSIDRDGVTAFSYLLKTELRLKAKKTQVHQTIRTAKQGPPPHIRSSSSHLVQIQPKQEEETVENIPTTTTTTTTTTTNTQSTNTSKKQQLKLFPLDVGELYTFGSGSNYQLGTGSNDFRPTPKRVSSMSTRIVTKVAASAFHTLALTNEGELFSFGFGRKGILGLGNEDTRPLPTKVKFDQSVTSIACSNYCSAVITSDGSLWTFGDQNDCGLLGTGQKSGVQCYPKRVILPEKQKVTSVAVGIKHCAVTTPSGDLFTWGNGETGALALSGIKEIRITPQKVVPWLGQNQKIAHAAVGDQHTVVRTSAGELYFMGYGNDQPSRVFASIPPKLTKGRAKYVSAAASRTVVALTDGKVLTWVGNQFAKALVFGASDTHSQPCSFTENAVLLDDTFVEATTDGERVLMVSKKRELFRWLPQKSQTTNTNNANNNDSQSQQAQILLTSQLPPPFITYPQKPIGEINVKESFPLGFMVSLGLFRVHSVAVSKEHVACIVDVPERTMSADLVAFNENIASLCARSDYSDFTLICEKKICKIPAHRIILACRSQFFRKLFIENPTKKEFDFDLEGGDGVEENQLNGNELRSLVRSIYGLKPIENQKKEQQEKEEAEKDINSTATLEFWIQKLSIQSDFDFAMTEESLNLFSDVQLVLEGRKFPAYRAFLACRSQYFDRMMSGPMREARESEFGLGLEGVDPNLFSKILQFLCCDSIAVNDVQEAVNLLGLADALMIDNLKQHCERYLVSVLEPDSIPELLQVCATYHNLPNLMRFCFEWIRNNIQRAIQMSIFTKIPDELREEFVSFLGNEDQWFRSRQIEARAMKIQQIEDYEKAGFEIELEEHWFESHYPISLEQLRVAYSSRQEQKRTTKATQSQTQSQSQTLQQSSPLKQTKGEETTTNPTPQKSKEQSTPEEPFNAEEVAKSLIESLNARIDQQSGTKKKKSKQQQQTQTQSQSQSQTQTQPQTQPKQQTQQQTAPEASNLPKGWRMDLVGTLNQMESQSKISASTNQTTVTTPQPQQPPQQPQQLASLTEIFQQQQKEGKKKKPIKRNTNEPMTLSEMILASTPPTETSPFTPSTTPPRNNSNNSNNSASMQSQPRNSPARNSQNQKQQMQQLSTTPPKHLMTPDKSIQPSTSPQKTQSQQINQNQSQNTNTTQISSTPPEIGVGPMGWGKFLEFQVPRQEEQQQQQQKTNFSKIQKQQREITLKSSGSGASNSAPGKALHNIQQQEHQRRKVEKQEQDELEMDMKMQAEIWQQIELERQFYQQLEQSRNPQNAQQQQNQSQPQQQNNQQQQQHHQKSNHSRRGGRGGGGNGGGRNGNHQNSQQAHPQQQQSQQQQSQQQQQQGGQRNNHHQNNRPKQQQNPRGTQ